MVNYFIAGNEKDFETGRALFREYAQSLSVDLRFQNFSNELETIAEQYNLRQEDYISLFLMDCQLAVRVYASLMMKLRSLNACL